MIELYDLLQRIKERPAMYLGSRSITCLNAFLNGYLGARHDMGVPRTQQEIEFEEFQEWIRKKFRITSSQSWAKIILFYSADEREALDKFFDLFEKFLIQEKSAVKQSAT